MQIETKSLLKALLLFAKYRKKYEDVALYFCVKMWRGRRRYFYYVECSDSSPTVSPTDFVNGSLIFNDTFIGGVPNGDA